MDSIYIVFIMFGLAAVIGLYLLICVVRRKKPKYWIGLAHAFFAIAAMAFFTVYTVLSQNRNVTSFIILIFVALLGAYMLYREFFGAQGDMVKSSVPTPLALLHALAALSAFILLIVQQFG